MAETSDPISQIDRLFNEYRNRYQAGDEPDPVEFLNQVEGVDRSELAALIDGFLARAPAREWDPEAFKASPAAAIADSLVRSLEGGSGLWPSVLPRLRDQVRLKRSEVVKQLADTLGVADSEEKVGAYYHEMERGLLPAQGISDRVLEALGSILDTSAEWLRNAGEAISPGPGGVELEAFARTTRLDTRLAIESPPISEAAADVEEMDEVDVLFRGRSGS